MSNWYANRDIIKDALGINTSATADHDQLDAVLESVSRLVDDYLGFHAFPASGTRYYTPREADRLSLDAPLLNLDTIQTASDGGSTFGSTMATGDVYLTPYNATEESPRAPWWGIEVKGNVTASGSVFPKGLPRSTRVVGTWGYFDERTTSTATVATAVNATAETFEVNGATSLHAGQTLRIGAEQMFVMATPTTVTSTHSSGITVLRARNGTTGATHSCATAIQVYEYPIIGRATLYQAERDYRAKDAPLGFAGGEPFGTQTMQQPGGLHPFARQMLAPFRKPVAI